MSSAHRLKASSCSAVKCVVNDTGDREWSATGDDFSAGDWVISWLTVNNTVIVPWEVHAEDRSRQAAVFEGQTHCHQQRISLLDPTAGEPKTGWRQSLRRDRKRALRRSLLARCTRRSRWFTGVCNTRCRGDNWLCLSGDFTIAQIQECRFSRKPLNRRDLFESGTHLAAIKCNGIRTRQPRRRGSNDVDARPFVSSCHEH